ncbi:MAG: type I restriction-modification system subunit M [Methanobrevibacter boviskoreani]|uniref:type I restriction-modification system subunit M n=1 Tax=Methanobrevibacter boviskoreani TaxID=1348249 RepID=UPI0023A7AE03|nr:type I restriction-modification system subunit M [Methanobrevibacter boviskoreani]MCI6930735.1 type I restriction-modification system subunit M [Methanobrevibacter boviskoreani]
MRTAEKLNNNVNEDLIKICINFSRRMDASEAKNYVLSLIFYKFLSEKEEKFLETREDIQNEKNISINELGYYIDPQFLFDKIASNENMIEDLKSSFKSFNENSNCIFEDIFENIDFDSNRLNINELKILVNKMSKISFIDEDSNITNTFEYLIRYYSINEGKRSGEYYTPSEISQILARIVSNAKENVEAVYDPTCGSCSSLIEVNDEVKVNDIYGQELNPSTYRLGKMNLLIHELEFKNLHIKNGNALESPSFMDKKFDAIVANPPFSARWSYDSKFREDPRFNGLGGLAPKTKADYAFIQDMLYHLDENGIMATIIPHGVLFRGGQDGRIRKYLIEKKNYLDTVIGLPANIFYGTSIPTCILVFKKERNTKDVLFIDASREFETLKRYQNYLSKENIDKIIETYNKREEIKKYSHIASFEEIVKNDFNLNIARYVDTYEPEKIREIKEIYLDIKKVNERINEINEEINEKLSEI